MELDFTRFNAFLSVLRDRILVRMADQADPGKSLVHSNKALDSPQAPAFKAPAEASEAGAGRERPGQASGLARLKKQGARAWVLHLKALFDAVDADGSGAIDTRY